jgi:4a-hydroxytetrahydrobiopterin dehydratase
MSELSAKHCIPCKGGIPPLESAAITELLKQLDSSWSVVDNHHLVKTYAFPDFARALALVNRIGAVAEDEGHHPDLYLAWGKVRVEIWTHKIDGLTLSDFVLAAKCDDVANP